MGFLTEEDGFGEFAHLLPDSVLELIAVAGTEAALTLVRRFGGTVIPVTMGATPQGRESQEWLAGQIGREAALRIGKTYGRYGRLSVPKCAKALAAVRDGMMRRDFDHYTGAGMTARSAANRIARDYGLTARRVWDILKIADEARQGDLFGGWE